ncbi:histone-lysine N-methyltransferase PRDM9-like [Clavelina lepadiformis]|uniref:histone-lysine N-methyltransferase PRDM9-like n=1 Tax=Clavelina lepadiformis TaxID=159417 RepID=UPI004042319F
MQTNDEPQFGVIRYIDRLGIGTKKEDLVVLNEDDYLYCDDCEQRWVGACPTHGSYPQIYNKLIKWGLPNRALRTCPPGINIGPSSVQPGGDGAWTDTDFPKNTVFGPYEGEYINQYNMKRFLLSYEGGFPWGIYKNGKLSHCLDAREERKSSWLKYIRRARNAKEQNVQAYQYQGKIYFRAIKIISSKSEILFWYEKRYAELLGIFPKKSKRMQMKDVLQLKEPKSISLKRHLMKKNTKTRIRRRQWTCRLCGFSAKSSIELKRHILYHSG